MMQKIIWYECFFSVQVCIKNVFSVFPTTVKVEQKNNVGLEIEKKK